ncbi:uncharacterized protein LOC143302871 [Bombus vancouverensis nearcticus]|uniref:uncharacterized protein LOC143302452 n=1 Tax=Bombus vancouverensis nearcticus TaxID=2705178 RepID=UPI00402B1B6A
MAQAEPISTLRRRRGALARGLAAIRRELDEYEASGKANRLVLTSCRSSFDELWKRILEVQYELDVLDEGEDARVDSLSQEHRELDVRFLGLFEQISATTPSTTNIGETRRKPEPTTVPEVRVPQFDGALENWTYFYDTFSSIVDRNESLTNVQKFQHLRSSITGRAAQSIQSLELTEANYSIALDTLKDKFNCPLQICMRHWNLMRNYPEIKKETPEALEDLLETLSVNLKALEHLKQPVTSNMAMIELIASKLPSSSLRKWQRTLPRQQVPSYQHLIDFLKTRANGTQFLSKEKESKGSAHKHHRQRTTIPHGRTLATTIRTVVCPTCNGPHEIRHCKVFKAKSATKRFQIVKKASLCINCLGRGHSLTQCTSGSCRICGHLHHTYLHREQTQVDSRSSSGRSSSGRSSSGRSASGWSPSSRSSDSRSSSGRSSGSRAPSGRSSGSRAPSGRSSGSRSSHKRAPTGQSPSGSSKSRSSHKSRRTSDTSRRRTSSSPRGTKEHASYESHSARIQNTTPTFSSKSQPGHN